MVELFSHLPLLVILAVIVAITWIALRLGASYLHALRALAFCARRMDGSGAGVGFRLRAASAEDTD